MSRPGWADQAAQLSTVALHSAQLGNWKHAGAAVRELNDKFGGRGIMFALVAWCDTLVVHQQQATGHGDGGLARPAWVNPATGDIVVNADDVPPEARWAGRLIAARAAMDHEAWDALVASIPDTPMGVTEHVSVLLTSVALTLNSLSGRGEHGEAL